MEIVMKCEHCGKEAKCRRYVYLLDRGYEEEHYFCSKKCMFGSTRDGTCVSWVSQMEVKKNGRSKSKRMGK